MTGQNTDKIIWRKEPDDYYSASIFVTKEGNIGINVGGFVAVKPIEEWHRFAFPEEKVQQMVSEAKAYGNDCVSGRCDL